MISEEYNLEMMIIKRVGRELPEGGTRREVSKSSTGYFHKFDLED